MKITIEISDSLYSNLLHYSKVTGKPSTELASRIVESAMLHFTAGVIHGLENALDTMKEK